MKFVLISLALLALSSCGSGEGKKNSSESDYTNDPVYKKGVTLVGRYKCLTCHAINETITGPPYMEIAKKYRDAPDTIVQHLAQKVITGGNGVWGQIMMIPHPDVSKEDAEAMVRYILMLR